MIRLKIRQTQYFLYRWELISAKVLYFRIAPQAFLQVYFNPACFLICKLDIICLILKKIRIMNRILHNAFIITAFIAIMFTSCKKESKNGSIVIEFTHSVGESAFYKDSLMYVNAAGNHYEVNELQYFISGIKLLKADGETVTITADSGIHYIDIDIPGSLVWKIKQEIPVSEYTSVSFTFGITEAMNKTGLFVNPPERDMFWPDIMGGGYHYMKMNGQWRDTLNQLSPFNFHIGVGMTDGMGGMGFVQNYFTVVIPNSAVNFNVDADQRLTLNMDIASWFDTPHLWDWNVTGGQIMQKQSAMRMACENGADAFSCVWKVE